jgi:hypothetical protein
MTLENIEQENLFNQVAVNFLTQDKNLAATFHKILTLCAISKTVDPKVVVWIKLLENITKEQFEVLAKIQRNFDYQIANRDFRNDDKLKREFTIREQGKMTDTLTGLIDVPAIDAQLLDSQVVLTPEEIEILTPFYKKKTEQLEKSLIELV